MRRVVFLILVSHAGFEVFGRTLDGSLDMILIPNNGVPSIVKSGETFMSLTREKGELKLVRGDVEIDLLSTWKELPGGIFEARSHVPEKIEEGFYSIRLKGSRDDANTRAVFVLKKYPLEYTFVHLTDIHIGSNRYAKSSEKIFLELADYVNKECRKILANWETHSNGEGQQEEVLVQSKKPSPPQFIVITGDLTESGEPEEFQRFVSLLDSFELPTFVCPGNHDRKNGFYQKYFYFLNYRFLFGEDGYIVFDTKDFLIADDADDQSGFLEIFRQELMKCRWVIGLTHRFDIQMGMRTQLILFVDNPIDLLVFGHYHRANKPEEKVVPWGLSQICMTPAGIDGAFRFIHVDTDKIELGEVQQPVSIQ